MVALSSRWRIWLTAVLLLALPVQGYAVASMLACGAGGTHPAHAGQAGHGQHAGTADHADHAHHVHHAHHVQADHQADHQADPHDPHSQHAAAQAGENSSQPEGDTGGCSACAACFVGAALPAADGHFVAHAEPEGYLGGITVSAVTVNADGLERPPRSASD
jgi:hypothetical protein